MCYFFIKHSSPDIANVVSQLSKGMGSTSMDAYKEMLRLMKFVLGSESFWLKIEPKNHWIYNLGVGCAYFLEI